MIIPELQRKQLINNIKMYVNSIHNIKNFNLEDSDLISELIELRHRLKHRTYNNDDKSLINKFSILIF